MKVTWKKIVVVFDLSLVKEFCLDEQMHSKAKLILRSGFSF